jgi:2-amino-4-hydroxy-6-hydroxymethyldihydropteridine diphosphokinase
MTAWIGIGSNLGDRKALIRAALSALSALGKLEAVSRVRRTKPFGGKVQPDYINLAARLSSPLSPEALLGKLFSIEESLGRVRTERWGSRTIDLDLLFCDRLVLDTPRLTLPHPGVAARRFVLEPLCDLDPGYIHPVLGSSLRELLDALTEG